MQRESSALISRMASPAELSLACEQPNNYTSAIQNIEDFLANLQEERNKIEAFKRELPLCMQLINNAYEVYKQQLETYRTSQDLSDKANWMVSAQLWSPAADVAKQALPPKETEKGLIDELALDGNSRSGSAFLPFSKEKNCRDRLGALRTALPELALASSEEVVVGEEEAENSVDLESGGRESCSYGRGAECGKIGGGGSSHKAQGQAAAGNRKVRRCWSPDLHRRFVNALQILGGSQVATPKQIRELMKVDGLTNDEVKSHLQKYRLHTRRPPPAPQMAAAAVVPSKVVVLGGIWVQPEYAAAAGAGPDIYGAHAAPPAHFYTRAPTVPHHLHPSVHLATAACKGRYSPEFEVRIGGERSESIRGEEREQESAEEEKPSVAN